jgi:RNA polymerase sigma factor (sigma-70 family)
MSAGESRQPVLQYLRRVHASVSGATVADAELLRRYAVFRDEAAFELLVWRHGAMVQRVCRGVLRDAGAVEDAFQAAFLALARQATAVARTASPAGWLHRVAYRVALKARTAAARRADREAAQAPRPGPPAADVAAVAAETVALLHEEVNRLASPYRIPIVLCYLEGKTHEEAALSLGWPKGTVSGRLARAREMLRRRLLRRGVAFSAAGLAVLLTESADAAITAPLSEATVRAASAYVGRGGAVPGASAAATSLANGVIRTMYLAKLEAAALACVAVGLVAGALAAGIGAGVADQPAANTPPASDAAAARRPADATKPLELAVRQRWQSVQNLKQIMLAVHNYASSHESRFPDNIRDKDGHPLLSWRVAILPFLEEDSLYSQLKLDEPWDGPHNKKLLAAMPKVYRAPTAGPRSTETFYQRFAGPGTMLDVAGPVRFTDIRIGMSNTLFAVEAGSAVPWTKPEDIPYDPKKPLPKLGGVFPHVITGAFVDGSADVLRKDFDEGTLRAAITRGGQDITVRKELVEPPLRLWAREAEAAGIKRPSQSFADEVSLLRTENLKLQEKLNAIELELLKAEAEVAPLRERNDRQSDPQAEARRLALQNQGKADWLLRRQDSLQRLRDEIARLKKVTQE